MFAFSPKGSHMDQTYPMNPFAPAYKQGMNIPPPEETGVSPKAFTYPYNPPNGQLAANQLLENDSVPIDTDADFYIAGWYMSLFTGVFQIALTDAEGYQLTQGFINSGGISMSASNPTILSPAHPIPAGGKIQINIQDLSAATNPLQIAFVGWKSFKHTIAV